MPTAYAFWIWFFFLFNCMKYIAPWESGFFHSFYSFHIYFSQTKVIIPDEIASITLFLASGESSYINGVVLAADAGWSAY